MDTINPFTGFICRYIQPARDYLTMPELVSLYQQELPAFLENLRYCFLFACSTGLAYNELEQLEEADIVVGIDGFKWIRTKRVKTGNPEDVPLLPIAEEIITRFRNERETLLKGKLLPVVSNQKYNKDLKEIAKICGIQKADYIPFCQAHLRNDHLPR